MTRRSNSPKQSCVYFIQAGKGGPIKIGRSTDVFRRFSGLQTGHSKSLKLLGVMHGGATKESQIHDWFSTYRTSGEWFRNNANLRRFIHENAVVPTKLKIPRTKPSGRKMTPQEAKREGTKGGLAKGIAAQARRNARVANDIVERLCSLEKLTWKECAWVLGDGFSVASLNRQFRNL